MLNSVAPPPSHSSWGSINHLGELQQQQQQSLQQQHAGTPVIHFPHAPPAELYTFEEEPATYEAQEAFAPATAKG